MRSVQPSVVAVQRNVMLSAVPSSGIVNSMIKITGIGDRDRPEWLIRISGMRSQGGIELRAIGALAALDLRELTRERPVSTVQEVADGFTLGFQPETTSPLLSRADPVIGNISAVHRVCGFQTTNVV
jgi:hypothetical protein